jgi:hypothetical protein
LGLTCDQVKINFPVGVGNIPQGTPVLAEGFYLLSRRFTNKQNKQTGDGGKG